VRSALAPLREREFRLLFVGRLTSQAGSAIAPIALAFAVLDITGSATDLGLVIAAGFVPQILLFLFGGVIADRFPRHRVMVTTDVIDGFVQLAAAALVLRGSAEIWHLAALNAVRGGATAFFFPAAQGLTPQTVPAAQLQEANAILRLTHSGTNIVGMALGGLLVAAVGPGWALGWDAATYFAGAAVLALMRTRSTRPAAADSRCSPSCATGGSSSRRARGCGRSSPPPRSGTWRRRWALSCSAPSSRTASSEAPGRGGSSWPRSRPASSSVA